MQFKARACAKFFRESRCCVCARKKSDELNQRCFFTLVISTFVHLNFPVAVEGSKVRFVDIELVKSFRVKSDYVAISFVNEMYKAIKKNFPKTTCVYANFAE